MRWIINPVIALALGLALALNGSANAEAVGSAIRETAELILAKFGRGTAGQTVKEVSTTTLRAVARYGETALPLLRRSGHAGFVALDQSGAKAPEILKLFARRGDEAVWLITDPAKLSLFLKHGESAAEALLKHPGIADKWIGRFGDDAVGAMNSISRQGAQRLSMIAGDGLSATAGSFEKLLPVIRKHGDEAMDFIWKNKGPLAISSVLATFIADPEAYISGAKQLIIDPVVSPVVTPIFTNSRGSWIVPGVIAVLLLPLIVRTLIRVRSALKRQSRS